MTDAELEAALIEAAKPERDTTPGVTAMFALAQRLDAERPEFAHGRGNPQASRARQYPG